MDRVIGYFRNQFEKNIRDRTSRWFHQQADRLFHHYQHPKQSIQSSSIEEENNPYEPLSSTVSHSNPTPSSSDHGSSDHTPNNASFRVRHRGRSQKRRQNPQVIVTPNTAWDQPFQTDSNNTSFGWSPFFQTPPWTPSSATSFRDPFGSNMQQQRMVVANNNQEEDDATAQMMTWPLRHV